MINKEYRFEVYADNWSYWAFQKNYPAISSKVHGDVAFAVIKDDGTLNADYPIFPQDPLNPWQQAAPPGCDGLAVGGWTNSQPGEGLYNVLTGASEKARQTLIETLVENAKKFGYKNVILDYENYSNPPPDPFLYTHFLQQLGQKLHKNGIELEIAISPIPANQNYYNLPELVHTNCVDRFHIMTYDYAMGQSGQIRVESNSSIAMTMDLLKQLENTIPQSKMMIGLPLYGLGYQLPRGTPLSQVAESLKNNSLIAVSYAVFEGAVPSITDDQLILEIGDWNNPKNGWAKLANQNHPPDYYYYNERTGVIISAFPPESIQDFARVIQEEFPDIEGAFAWEAQGDFKGKMMEEFVNALGSKKRDSTHCRALRQVRRLSIRV
ncbi:MAG: glycoside hydrolase family 18 protein [Chlamydiota bacterium]